MRQVHHLGGSYLNSDQFPFLSGTCRTNPMSFNIIKLRYFQELIYFLFGKKKKAQKFVCIENLGFDQKSFELPVFFSPSLLHG